MIKTVSELQDLIVWAKAQKLKSVEVQGIRFEFSDLAHIEGLNDLASEPARDLSKPASSPRLPDGNAQANEDEELLFYSSR